MTVKLLESLKMAVETLRSPNLTHQSYILWS